MKKFNIKHLGFILSMTFILTACNKFYDKDYFLNERILYYTKDTLEIYSDLEADEKPKQEVIGNTVYKQENYNNNDNTKDIEISSDGRYLYYIKYSRHSNNSGDLICEDLNFNKIQKKKTKDVNEKNKVKTKIISSNISSFDLLFTGKVLYYNQNDNSLSIWNGENTAIIASNISDYKVDYYENILLYTIKKGEGYDLYSYSLNIDGGAPNLLDINVSNLINESITCDRIFYTKKELDKEVLYCIKHLVDIEEILQGEFTDYLVNPETGNIYFTKKGEGTDYGTVYFYDSSEEELTKLIEGANIKDFVEGKYKYDMAFITTRDSGSYLAKSNTLFSFTNLNDIKYIYARPEDMTLFYLAVDNSNNKSNLYSVNIEGSSIEAPTKIDGTVESIDRLYNGKIYYYKKTKNSLELYRSGIKLKGNVKKAFYLFGSVYIAFDDGDSGFSLYRIVNDKASKVLDENIHSFKLLNNGYIVYIKEFNNGVGDLYIWNGKDSKMVVEKVSAIGNEFSLSRSVYEKE